MRVQPCVGLRREEMGHQQRSEGQMEVDEVCSMCRENNRQWRDSRDERAGKQLRKVPNAAPWEREQRYESLQR